MKSIRYFVILGILPLLGCNIRCEETKVQNKHVICRLSGMRIFDVKQTPQEVKANTVTSYRVISEEIAIYNDRICEWSFTYIDEEQHHTFTMKLPDDIFKSLTGSLKTEKHYKLKDGVIEIKYDFSNSSASYPKGVTKVLEFLTDKYKKDSNKKRGIEQ